MGIKTDSLLTIIVWNCNFFRSFKSPVTGNYALRWVAFPSSIIFYYKNISQHSPKLITNKC